MALDPSRQEAQGAGGNVAVSLEPDGLAARAKPLDPRFESRGLRAHSREAPRDLACRCSAPASAREQSLYLVFQRGGLANGDRAFAGRHVCLGEDRGTGGRAPPLRAPSLAGGHGRTAAAVAGGPPAALACSHGVCGMTGFRVWSRQPGPRAASMRPPKTAHVARRASGRPDPRPSVCPGDTPALAGWRARPPSELS